MKIVLDMDSTTTATHDAVLLLYREMTGDYSTFIDDENLVWNMKDICKQWSKQQMDDVFCNPKLYSYMKPFSNAIEVLSYFKEQGDYLELCSMHRADGIVNKRKWVEENLTMLDKITILPLDNGLVKFDKSSVLGDVIIDDRIDALTSSLCPIKICYGNYTWNKEWKGLRVKNWLELKELIDTLRVMAI